MTSRRSCSDGVDPGLLRGEGERTDPAAELDVLAAAAQHRPAELGEGRPVQPGGLLRGRRLQLALVHRLELRPAGQLRTHDRSRRGADDEVGAGQVDAGIGQPGEEADLPGDAGDPATAEHEGGALVAHRRHPHIRPRTSTPRVSWATLCARLPTTRGCAWPRRSPPPPPRAGPRDSPGRWTTRRSPVGSILRAAVRRWGDRPAFIDHDVPLTFTELGAPRARRRRLARRPRRRPGRRRRRPHPQLPAVPAALLRDPAGRGDLLPHQPAAPGRGAGRPAHRRRREGADHLGPGAALRPRRAGRHPGGDRVVTGEAHIARLRRAARARGRRRRRSPTCWPPTPPTGTSTPTSTPPTDLAHLAYTGGTTGVSKGVELPHRNVVTNVLQSACWTSGSVPALDEAGDVTLRQVLGEDEQPTRLGEARIVNLTPVVPRDGRDRLPERPGHGRDDDRHPHALRPGQVRRGRREVRRLRDRRGAAGLRRSPAGARVRRPRLVPRARGVQRRRAAAGGADREAPVGCSPTRSSARATG